MAIWPCGCIAKFMFFMAIIIKIQLLVSLIPSASKAKVDPNEL